MACKHRSRRAVHFGGVRSLCAASPAWDPLSHLLATQLLTITIQLLLADEVLPGHITDHCSPGGEAAVPTGPGPGAVQAQTQATTILLRRS
jgi:hypothetical protein